jgi:hypothetical protein
MKYVCFVYADERALARLSAAQIEALEQRLREVTRVDQRDTAALLEGGDAAVLVRLRDGALTVAAGPCAETGEQVSALAVVEAANLDEALGIAARIGSPAFGTVEVRPVRELVRRGPHRIARANVTPLRLLP